MGIYVPTEDLLDDIKVIAQNLGRTPLITEYNNLGKYSTGLARNRFGSWSATLKAANLELGPEHRHYRSDSEIEIELKRVEGLVGHLPSWSELKKYSTISPDVFAYRLGKSNFTDPRNPPLSPDWKIENIKPEDGYWIAGIITGEGSFTVSMGTVEFRIGLRADDIAILEYVQQVMDLPQLIGRYSNAKRRLNGQKVGDEARMSISNRWVNKLRVIPFFDRFSLRGRKAAEFQVFKRAVWFLCQRDDEGRFRRRFTEEERKVLTELTNTMKNLRIDPTAHQGGPQ